MARVGQGIDAHELLLNRPRQGERIQAGALPPQARRGHGSEISAHARTRSSGVCGASSGGGRAHRPAPCGAAYGGGSSSKAEIPIQSIPSRAVIAPSPHCGRASSFLLDVGVVILLVWPPARELQLLGLAIVP